MVEHSDIGCWIVKGDPMRWDYFAWLDNDQSRPVKPHVHPNNWSLGDTYRNDLIQRGDRIALWITGSRHPGIYEFGWITSDHPEEGEGWDRSYLVDTQDTGAHPSLFIEFASVRLRDNYLPRAEMKADPVLSGAEQFRAPQITNPSYLDPLQAKALARLLSTRVSQEEFTASQWAGLL